MRYSGKMFTVRDVQAWQKSPAKGFSEKKKGIGVAGESGDYETTYFMSGMMPDVVLSDDEDMAEAGRKRESFDCKSSRAHERESFDCKCCRR